MGHRRDGDGRRQDEPDGEEPDRLRVRAQLAQRAEERCAVEERGQDCDEDDVRRQLDRRHARNEPEHQASDDERDRVRDPDRLGQGEERCGCRQDSYEGEAVCGGEVHGPSFEI